MLPLTYIAFIAICFYWQVRVVKAGKSTKVKAIGLFALYSLAPTLLYGTVFMILVGIEELADAAIIGEGYARSLVFVIVGGWVVVLLATAVFSLVLLFLKRNDGDET